MKNSYSRLGKEEYEMIKPQLEKVNSWENFIVIEKPDSHTASCFVERFVEHIPKGPLQKQFEQALNRRHLFREFNCIIHNSEYREKWFNFKQKELENYVREKLQIFDDEDFSYHNKSFFVWLTIVGTLRTTYLHSVYLDTKLNKSLLSINCCSPVIIFFKVNLFSFISFSPTITT